MNILSELRHRFRVALEALSTAGEGGGLVVTDGADLDALLDMIRPAQDPRFGDYQANCAMPLGKRLGRSPREVAADLVAATTLDDLCEEPEIAGPGFINLRLRTPWLTGAIEAARQDGQRLGVPPSDRPRKFVLDYSSPNVAKPMHVGHIRSTVIGDALARTLRFLGHQVITDNHLGDWGTQFGMILYGYKHFLDADQYARDPVVELGRLYKLVHQLMGFQELRQRGLPELEQRMAQLEAEYRRAEELVSDARAGDAKALKKAEKAHRATGKRLEETRQELTAARQRLATGLADPHWQMLVEAHSEIGSAVLGETAALHAGDPTNLRLWQEFMPACKQALLQVYQRLDVQFDFEYGESFYQPLLGPVVQELEQRGLTRVSEGAVCLFPEGFETPMIIRKRDGAFLYATTDLATIKYRMEQWSPDAILYVVDHRQSEHFDKLFAAVRLWGYQQVELQHVSFGTVLGDDGRPFRTRDGDAVGLESLLDEAVQRARRVVAEKAASQDLDPDHADHVAQLVGIGAIKYADLAHNRQSDYTFSYDKMMSLEGNTSTYMQYSYARIQSIFARGGVSPDQLRAAEVSIRLDAPAERRLALAILRFAEALNNVQADYRPNHLTGYLFDELGKSLSQFYEQCSVLQAESEALRLSRLALCDLTGRVIRQGLELLGIQVVDRM